MEVAGLTISIVPLVIEAAKKYHVVCELLQTYRNCTKEVFKLHAKCSTSGAIFENECLLLLSLVEDRKVLLEIIGNPNSHHATTLWHERLDRGLSQKMDEYHGGLYHRLGVPLRIIIESLEMIQKEMEGYKDELGSKPNSDNFSKTPLAVRVWVEKVRKRLSFALAKSSLEKKSNELQGRVEMFCSISFQVTRFESLKNQAEGSQARDHASLEDCSKVFQAVRTLSQNVYEALVPFLNDRDHQDSLIDLSCAMGSKVPGATSPTEPVVVFLEHSSLQRPMGMIIETPVLPNPMQWKKQSAKQCRQTLLDSLRSMEGRLHTLQAQGLRSQRSTDGLLRLAARSSAPNILSHLPAPEPKLGYRVVNQWDTYGTVNAIPLSDHLRGNHRIYTKDNFSRDQICALAKHAALAVLQYHSTPWLPDSRTMSKQMTAENIPENPLDTSKMYLRLLERPKNLFSSMSEGNLAESRLADQALLHDLQQPRYEPGIKNEALFGLGIVLLELESDEPLDTILSRFPEAEWGAAATQERTNESLFHRLLLPKYRAGYRIGAAYGNIVRKCLDCDFGLGLRENSLKDRELQVAVYNQVVRELESLRSSLWRYSLWRYSPEVGIGALPGGEQFL